MRKYFQDLAFNLQQKKNKQIKMSTKELSYKFKPSNYNQRKTSGNSLLDLEKESFESNPFQGGHRKESCSTASAERSSILTTNFEALSLLDESEELLVQTSKKQRKISDYSEEEGIGYSSRETILDWCEKVLNSIILTTLEKESIFHRFSTAYDFIMEKLHILRKSITTSHDLKKLVVTIFLITYKFEGFVIGKITISSLVSAFLKNLGVDEKELEKTVLKTELKILKMLDYDSTLFDNNIHQLSFILFDLMKNKFLSGITPEEQIKVETYLMDINRLIQFSDKVIFDVLPLDKAAVSLFCTLEILKSEVNISDDTISVFYNYLKKDLRVIKMEDQEFKELCKEFRDDFFKGFSNEFE